MKIAAFQFHGSDTIRENLLALERGIFPEYFRELFKESVEIALVSFCDVSPTENVSRYELLRSHLVTVAQSAREFCLWHTLPASRAPRR